MPSLTRRLVAEFIGTFGFVFFGCGAVVANAYPGSGIGVPSIALVHGIALAVLVTATMAISGGLLNPALTVGLFVARRLDAKSTVGYIIVQCLGAILGALALKLLFPIGIARLVSYGTPMIANTITLPAAIAIEALLTFFLMSAVFGTAVLANAPRVGGFAIGLTLYACIVVAAQLTGPAVNPARAFGPAVVSGVWVGHIAYWIGPIVGAVVAALLWDRVLLPPREDVTVVVEV
ncbi:MAG: MIP/aquaporin family protein [Bacillota bacterium]